MKPTYHIANARIFDEFGRPGIQGLEGTNIDNPNCTIGGWIVTSSIVSREGNRVETRKSVYVVDSWEVNPDVPPIP